MFKNAIYDKNGFVGYIIAVPLVDFVKSDKKQNKEDKSSSFFNLLNWLFSREKVISTIKPIKEV